MRWGGGEAELAVIPVFKYIKELSLRLGPGTLLPTTTAFCICVTILASSSKIFAISLVTDLDLDELSSFV